MKTQKIGCQLRSFFCHENLTRPMNDYVVAANGQISRTNQIRRHLKYANVVN